MARPVTLVTFVLPAPLRHWAGETPGTPGTSGIRVFAVADREDGHPTLGSALDTLRRVHPALEQRLRDDYGGIRRHITMFVCGENAHHLGGLDCALPPGAEILVLPALSRRQETTG